MDVASAIERVPLLADLDLTTRRRVAETGVVTTWAAGEALWQRGEGGTHLQFLLRGRIHLNVLQQSRRPLTLARLGEGELACGAAVCRGASYCCDALIAEQSQILTVPLPVLLPDRDGQPFVRALLDTVSDRTMLMCRRVREAAGARVDQRVAALLLRLADERGEPARGGRVRLRKVSREELAALCAARPESVVRALSAFQRAGFLEKRRGDIVLDVDALSGAIA